MSKCYEALLKSVHGYSDLHIDLCKKALDEFFQNRASFTLTFAFYKIRENIPQLQSVSFSGLNFNTASDFLNDKHLNKENKLLFEIIKAAFRPAKVEDYV